MEPSYFAGRVIQSQPFWRVIGVLGEMDRCTISSRTELPHIACPQRNIHAGHKGTCTGMFVATLFGITSNCRKWINKSLAFV